MGEQQNVVYVAPHPGKFPYIIGGVCGCLPFFCISMVLLFGTGITFDNYSPVGFFLEKTFDQEVGARFMMSYKWFEAAACLMTVAGLLVGVVIGGNIIRALWDWFYE